MLGSPVEEEVWDRGRFSCGALKLCGMLKFSTRLKVPSFHCAGCHNEPSPSLLLPDAHLPHRITLAPQRHTGLRGCTFVLCAQ